MKSWPDLMTKQNWYTKIVLHEYDCELLNPKKNANNHHNNKTHFRSPAERDDDSNLDNITYDDFQYLWKPTSSIFILTFPFRHFIFFSILRRVQVSVLVFYDWIIQWLYETFPRPFIDFGIYIYIFDIMAYIWKKYVLCICVHICTVYFVCSRVVY